MILIRIAIKKSAWWHVPSYVRQQLNGIHSVASRAAIIMSSIISRTRQSAMLVIWLMWSITVPALLAQVQDAKPVDARLALENSNVNKAAEAQISVKVTNNPGNKANEPRGDQQTEVLVSKSTDSAVLPATVSKFTSDLPLIILTKHGGTLTNRERVKVSVTVVGLTNGRSSVAGPIAYQGKGELWLRGNSTRRMPKQPYRLEIQDSEGDDLKVPLLGMPKESDWILHACYFDKSFVRDALAYELWRAMRYYAPRTRYVEVFLNEAGNELTMDDYLGLYVFMEKIKRGKNRLDIRKLRPTDTTEPAITGGYIFKKDRPNPGEKGFKTSKGILFVYEEPKERNITDEQKQWLKDYVDRFESALYSKDFCDPEKGYAQYLDLKSFVDFHWIGEMSRNMDAYWASEYFYKNCQGKLMKGPIWDWDLAFGNVSYLSGFQTNGWRWQQVSPKDYGWYGRMFDDPDFVQLFIDRWAVLRRDVFATSNMLARVDRLAAQVQEAQARNFERWPILGKRTWPNWLVAKSYQEEVDYLKKWIANRLAWIDSQGFPPPVATVTSAANGGRRVEFKFPLGKVFYTTDGTDPRAHGGVVSPTAAEYATPFAVPADVEIIARLRSDYQLWSPPVVLKQLNVSALDHSATQ